MWMVWGFLLMAVPGLLLFVGNFLDWLLWLVTRSRTPVFKVAAIVASVVVIVTMILGATLGRTKLRVTQVDVVSDRVPAAFDGYRIAQISDLHVGTMARPERQIAGMAAKIASLRPDLVVCTGDLVNRANTEITPSIIEALAGIEAPDGVFSAWGNHDLGFYITGADSVDLRENFVELGRKVAATGWRVLPDESVWIRRETGETSGAADSILLSGVNYPRWGHHNGSNSVLAGADLVKTFAGVAGDPYSIVLAHTPDQWEEVTATGHGDLTLSGHVHAMQMKLSLFGLVFSPAQWVYDHWSGAYTRTDETSGVEKMLYVNDGTGCVGYPMRIGARPQITLFTLKRRCG